MSITTTISIDQVFELLSDAQHSLRKREPSLLAGPTGPTSNLVVNTDTVSKQDILQAFIYTSGGYSHEDIYIRALNIIADTTLSEELRNQYIAVFIEYFSLAESNNKTSTDPSNKGSASGFMERAINSSKKSSEYFDAITAHKGDISQIGFYNVIESETISGMPTIIPSSISIQEQLLNQPVPVVRSKSVGVIPDHRGKHMVSIDILYPNFESFSSTEEDYPSFINLFNMFKFMPINSIYSPILSSAFISEYTFPKLFDLVKQVFSNEEFKNLSEQKSEKAKIEYIANQLSANDLSLTEIKGLFSHDDANLDIGLSTIADNILARKEIDAGRREDVYDSENLKDFIVNYESNLGFPVPVAFKSASVQSHADMPGAIIARFVFGIISSPAFPYGSVMYRDIEGKPSYNPNDCHYGKKYVNIAAKKVLGQAEVDVNNILKTSKDVNLEPIGLNDLRLYYFDFQDGPIIFDTANPRYDTSHGSAIVLEKISGAFNTKSVEVPLMGSKFPSVQYMGINSNACQLIFNVTDKQVIADFMAMKARVVDSEKNQAMHHSYAVVENVFINSLGISRITPQSIAIDSDPDIPDLYRLTINFIENYQDIDSKERLRLERGVQGVTSMKKLWRYFYDLYLIWYKARIAKEALQQSKDAVDYNNRLSDVIQEAENIFPLQYHIPTDELPPALRPESLRQTYIDDWYLQNPRPPQPLLTIPDKLDDLMEALGIQEKYVGNDAEESSVLSPGRGPHDVYYGPLLMGIIEEYAKARGATSATGYLEYDFPNLLRASVLLRYLDEWFSSNETTRRSHIQEIVHGIAVGYTQQDAVSRKTRENWQIRHGTSGHTATSGTVRARSNKVLYNVLGYHDSRGLLFGSLAHGAPEYKNLVDMFHKNGTPIPREIWESSFEAILDRKYTKGNDILVSFNQMDDAFAMLAQLISKYEDSYKFDLVTDPKTKDEFTELRLYYGLARLNLSELKRNKTEIESINKQIINLYPDLYLPTYMDLIRDEPEMELPWNQVESPSFTAGSKQDFIKSFLITFAPKYGDTGTVPNFKNFKDLEMSPKEISAMTSVTVNHYIDPDIFYFRQRDKNNMHTAITTAAKQKNETEELLKTGRTISLPVSYRQIQDLAREKLIADGTIAQDVSIRDGSDEIEMAISELFEEALSEYHSKSRASGSEGDIGALQSFSAMGINELDPRISERLKELVKGITNYDPEDTNSKQILHLEVITNDGKVIGDIIPDDRTKYRVIPGARVGGSPTYYTATSDMSFSLGDDFQLATDERSLLHTPDLTDSVLKSFPTIRVYFIEEDRDHSFMKDDFYGFTDVIECNITSHIYDNDVCRMKLANFSGVLTTMQFTDFKHTTGVKKSYSEAGNIQPNKEDRITIVDEAREKFLKKIMLRPGVHIMIKLGYGNNLDSLKTVFTGEIAELKPGPIVELVAQGYQTELHNEFGGFMEEGFWESGLSVFEGGLDESLKFGFMKIINFILLSNDKQNKRLAKNNMMHLGEAFSTRSRQKGLFGKYDPNYNYYNRKLNKVETILGEPTTQDFIADSQGEMFSWFDSWLESQYFGFAGTNVSRNIYIADSNNTDINVTNEWLITNAPVIDSLREAVRYMPNFIATVVPYEQDATLFIGDPTNIYQYRTPNEVEHKYEVKMNAAYSGIRSQSARAHKNNDINRVIDTINRKNFDFAKTIDRANIAYERDRSFGYPIDLADKIDDMMLGITPAKTLLKEINPEIIGHLFCNYYGIAYDKSKLNDYTSYVQRLLDIELNSRWGYVHAEEQSFWGQQRERAKNFLISIIPLRGYKASIRYNDPTPRIAQYSKEGTMFQEEPRRLLPWATALGLVPTSDSAGDKASAKYDSLEKELSSFVLDQTQLIRDPVLEDRVFGFKQAHTREILDRRQSRSYVGSIKPVISLRTAIIFLNEIIKERRDYIENQAAELAREGSDYELNNIIPWNYKIFRDHHVLSSEHDLIANNLTASESDMWSAVALRVPMDTVETINGFTWQAFQWGVEEGGVDPTAGTYRIDSDQTFGIYPNKLSGGVNYLGRYPGPKDVLENFTEINATTPSLAQTALKFRLAQGLSKMYRGNLICLGRNIKPYDQIQIMDNVNNMYGKVMVERVIQHFSATTGWTTTIVPCALTRVNSKQASHNVSNTDKWLYTLSQGKTGRYLMNAATLLTFGSAGLGLRGGLYFLGRAPFGFIKRLATGVFGGSSGGLWSAVKYPYYLAAGIARKQSTVFAARFAARFGLNPLKGGGSGVMLLATGIKGTTDVLYQFNNMSISQSVALKDGTTVHQPCHLSVVTYNGAPFLAGLEDPISSMTNNDAWAQLSAEFEYAWREWTSKPRGTFNADEALNRTIESTGGD